MCCFQTNQFWGLAGSPYVVRQTIKVAYSAKLTIQAGVDVVFIGLQTGLIVEGAYGNKIDCCSGFHFDFVM